MNQTMRERWLSGGGSYESDVLWEAVVRGCVGDEDSTDEQIEAAYAAFSEYAGDELEPLMVLLRAADGADIPMAEMVDVIEGHELLEGVIEAVDTAITAIVA